MCVKKVSPDISSPALDKIREMSWANGRHDWTVQIPNFLEEAGFENVSMEHFGDEPSLVRAFNEQHFLTMHEFTSSLKNSGKMEAAQTFFRLIEEGYRESTTGAALCIPRIVCVARKPLQL